MNGFSRSYRLGPSWATLAITLAVAACSRPAADRDSTAQVDTLSNGRVLVTNTGVPAWTPKTAWRLEEDLRLGTAEDSGTEAEQFGLIMSVVSDSLGMIYVLDVLSQDIRVFHPTGTFSHTIGRKGPGPGELSGARAMTFGPGETLWVVDDGAARYSVFAPDGTFLASHPRRIQGYLSSASGTVLFDGSYLDWGPAFPDGRFGPRVLYHPIRLATGFERPDSLAPLQHTWKMLPSGRMPEYLFGGGLSVAVDRRGGIWFAHMQEYRIYRRTLEGDTSLVFSLPATAARLGEAERAYVRAQYARMPSLLTEYLDALPETKPIVRRILPDNAGHIFVLADVAAEPAGSIVDVFRDSGEYRGRLILPTLVAPSPRQPPVAHATPEHLFIVTKDDLDVSYVSRLKIVRGDG